MSENSEVAELKSQESEITTPGNSGETGKALLRRNYCYVCDIQCTALKNFLDHQKGKKHLKKLELKDESFKQNNETIIKTKSTKKNSTKKNSTNKNTTNKNTTKKNSRSSNSSKPYEQKSNKSKLHGVHNSDDKGMNNSKRLNPKYKGNHYNSNNQNHYSRHQNSRYSYSNHYENNQRYYNEQQRPSFSRWRASQYPDSHSIHNNFEHFEFAQDAQYYPDPDYNEPYHDEFFLGNINASHGYEDEGSCLPFSSAEPQNSLYCFNRNEISDVNHLESNSIPSESANKPTANDKSSFTYASETRKSKQGSVVDSNKSLIKTKNSKQVSPRSSQILNSSNLKVGEKKRLRTLSLSSVETVNNDKKFEDKNENIAADSESTPEEQKLKEYTTSLLETNPNRISLMIQHPSSHKEKAVLNHIMTSFSKTRRKENLTRKLRSNSLGSGNNDDSTLDIQSVSSENDEISIILPSEVACFQTNNDSDQSKCPSFLKRSESNSEECNLDSGLNNKDSGISNSSQILLSNQNSKKSSKVNGKSKENSFSTSKSKTYERRKEKNSERVCPTKRKSCDDNTNSKIKKQRSCDGRNFLSSTSRKSEQKDANKNISPVVNSPNQSLHIEVIPVSPNETVPIKEELTSNSQKDSTDMNQATSVIETSEAISNQIDYNSQFSLETLIELFASGDVAVKKEFNDPVIEAIKEVDPNELINACSNDSHMNSTSGTTRRTSESNAVSSKSPAFIPDFSVQENTNCINPVILGSTVDNIITPVSMPERPVLTPSPAPTEISTEQNTLSTCGDLEKHSFSEMEELNLIGKVKSEFPHFITLIEKLQEIACKEETIKKNITQAKFKINEYHNLLEDWKNKKKKLHVEEEELRKERNDIIQLMQNAVNVPQSTDIDKNKTDSLSKVHSTLDKNMREQSTIEANNNTGMSSASISSSLSEKQPKKKKPNCPDSDEILILPSPVKPDPPEIILIDDMEEISRGSQNSSNTLPLGEITPNFPNQGSSLLDTKNLTAHSTVINCLVVFDDFLYTCSNDNSAKRFSVKDTSDTVTYLHTGKNVTEIAVEKVQNEALVFTSCSNRVLSLFIASNGTKIKSFFQSSNIKSICKGWGKFYAAMEDGTVNVYNWKYEEKEFIKTQLSPASRIATVHQGGLHILIILTTDGHISLRDAKTSLLIRLIKTSFKLPAWLTVHNDFVYLSSSDRTISVLDIQSGKVEKKWQLGQNQTGLAVCEDHFFTISYSGIICCVNKEKFSDATLFYGAGKTGLTCIHVYQNWVFTGNRKGDISVFQFDPYSRFSCKIAKCRSVFGSRDDLALHFELQHLKKKNLALCNWEYCPFIFPVNFNTNDKIDHLKKHILPMPRGSTA